jgi:hypothetical protein
LYVDFGKGFLNDSVTPKPSGGRYAHAEAATDSNQDCAELERKVAGRHWLSLRTSKAGWSVFAPAWSCHRHFHVHSPTNGVRCNARDLALQRLQEIWGNPSWERVANLLVPRMAPRAVRVCEEFPNANTDASSHCGRPRSQRASFYQKSATHPSQTEKLGRKSHLVTSVSRGLLSAILISSGDILLSNDKATETRFHPVTGTRTNVSSAISMRAR